MTNLLIGLCLCATVVQAILPLQDANAYIDQLFTYKIDSADFPNQHVKVAEAGSDSLPTWLHFDPESLTLKGIPGIKDLGTYIFAVGPDPSHAQDAFAVIVSHRQRLEVAQAASSEEQAVICKPHDSITMVNVMINTDLDQLTTAIKTGLLETLSSHLSLQPKHISLKPNNGKASESAPLVAGPGDSKPDSSNAASVISWVVGCGAVKSHQMDVLELLETSAKTGKLSEMLGQGVLGWQVISDTPKIINNRRLKREIRATATPTPGGESTVTPKDKTDMPTVPKESSVTIAPTTDSISTPSPIISAITTDAAITPTTPEKTPTKTPDTTPTTVTTATNPTTLSTATTLPSTTPSTVTTATNPTTLSTATTPTPSTTLSTATTATNPTTLSTATTPTSTILPNDANTPVTKPTRSTDDTTIERITRSTTIATGTPPLSTPIPPPSSPSTIDKIPDISISSSTLEVEETTQPAVTTVEITNPPPMTPPPPPVQSKPILDVSKKPAKQMVKVGKLLEYERPRGLFKNKDGDDPFMYEVVEVNSENVNRPSSWVMYDTLERTVYALPTADDEGLHKFSIVATDNSNGMSNSVTLDIEVAPADESGVSMFYMMYVEAPFMGEPREVLHLAMQLIEDGKVENLYVKSTQRDGDMVVVTFGEDLNQEDCSDNGGTSSTRRKLKMEDYYIRKTTKTLMISSLRLMPKAPCENTPPEVGSYFEQGGQNVRVIIGQLYREELPVDAFVDDEDIDLRFMTLKLNLFGIEKEANDLISLDSRTLKALVWEETASSSQFELVAEDSMGATVNQALNVELVKPYTGNPSHLFSITLDENYSKFANNLDQQIMLYEKLQEAFPNSDLIFEKVVDGSVVVDFTLENDAMKSTAEGECPVKQLDALNEEIFAADGSIRESFSNRMPSLSKAEFIPRGDCEGEIQPKSGDVKRATRGGDKDDEEDSNLVIIIIVVVAVVVVILIIVVVVIVVRRKRNEKMNVSRNNGTYIEKGIPKVFDEEMKDVGKNEPNESQPLMADAERPAPPAYPQNGKKAGDGTSDSSYQPPTPPVSEPDENRQQYDKSP